MNKYEELLDHSEAHAVSLDENVHFKSELLGLYVYDNETLSNNIALSDRLITTAEKSCVLAEELGHYHTSSGVILDMNDAGNRKQERTARLWAYNHIVGIRRLVDAFLAGCRNRYEIAEYLNITEDFLQELLDTYEGIYGVETCVDGYYVRFVPNLQIMKMGA